jgi:hypothetical protein
MLPILRSVVFDASQGEKHRVCGNILLDNELSLPDKIGRRK